MELLFILIIPLAAAALSLVATERRFAPALTIAGAIAVLILALKTAFMVIKAGQVVLAAGWISCNSLRALIGRTYGNNNSRSGAWGLCRPSGRRTGHSRGGVPPFAAFLSEFSILKAGIAGGHYIAMTLLGIFILMAFAAVMFHVNRMVFGRPPDNNVKTALPKTALISLTMALVSVIVFGLYIPDCLYKLLHLAAASLGR